MSSRLPSSRGGKFLTCRLPSAGAGIGKLETCRHDKQPTTGPVVTTGGTSFAPCKPNLRYPQQAAAGRDGGAHPGFLEGTCMTATSTPIGRRVAQGRAAPGTTPRQDVNVNEVERWASVLGGGFLVVTGLTRGSGLGLA